METVFLNLHPVKKRVVSPWQCPENVAFLAPILS